MDVFEVSSHLKRYGAVPPTVGSRLPKCGPCVVKHAPYLGSVKETLPQKRFKCESSFSEASCQLQGDPTNFVKMRQAKTFSTLMTNTLFVRNSI